MNRDHEDEKSKRCRSKAPRVRTGCITCKARRVKCDETKPTCLRCQQDRHTCDGYKTAPRLKPGPKPRPKPNPDSEANLLRLQRISKDSRFGRFLLPRRHAHLPMQRIEVPPVMPDRMFASDGDTAFFRHAQSFVLNYVACLCDPSDFWYCYVMPLAHSTTPLKYAICALGAAHRHFLLSGPGDLAASKDEILSSEIAAIEKYNSAIAHIQTYARHNHRGFDAFVPVICCVIFICIEQLLGRYNESVRHLQAGCGMLGSPSGLPAAAASMDLRNSILRVFYHLGIDSIDFTGENVLDGLPGGHPMPDMGSRHEPFASYEEATKMLERVDTIYHIAFATPANAPDSRNNQKFDWELQDQAALDTSRQAFDVWKSRFELLQQSGVPAPGPQPHCHQVDQLLFSFERGIWEMLAEMKSFDDPVDEERCKAVVSRAEAVAAIYEADKQPTFAPGGDIIPILALICFSCEDRDIKLRIVAVLRSLRRREGVWDSREVANDCETMTLTGQMPEQFQ